MATYRPHKDFTLRAKLLLTQSTDTTSDLARSSEATFGFAWRPSFTDRFALLGRYTYLDEGVTPAQSSNGPVDPITGQPLGVRERAHVVSLAGEGRLFWKISLAEKIAAKCKEEPDENTASWSSCGSTG